TPAGLPKLFHYRKTWDGAVGKTSDEEDRLGSVERVRRFYHRVIRAEFSSLTRVEIEVADRHAVGRRYVSVMELQGIEWKLTSLRSVGGPAMTASTMSNLGMP